MYLLNKSHSHLIIQSALTYLIPLLPLQAPLQPTSTLTPLFSVTDSAQTYSLLSSLPIALPCWNGEGQLAHRIEPDLLSLLQFSSLNSQKNDFGCGFLPKDSKHLQYLYI